MERFATIVGTGRYLPEIEVTNKTLKDRVSVQNPDLANVVDAFEESSGIRSRWYAPRDWAASDIALRAAHRALEAAGIGPEQVDMILLGTDTQTISRLPRRRCCSTSWGRPTLAPSILAAPALRSRLE